MRRLVSVALASVAVGLASTSLEAGASGVVQRARAAIERGDVDPVRDLAPLVKALGTTGGDGLDTLIRGIEELGGYDSASPAAVKAYLQKEAAPALIAVAGGKASWSTRGDALMALRSLNAPDDVLDRAIAVAEADTSKESGYIRSRGRLLADWKRSRPQPAMPTTAPVDPERERRALATLKRMGLRVSPDTLNASSIHARPDEVQALLEAGLSPNENGRTGSVLTMAAGVGCAADEGSLEDRLATVRVLIQYGADVKAADSLGNTPLLQAAQLCPLAVVQLLVDAGADVNATNQMGTSPLMTAFLGNHWDTAEYLVEKGARMKKSAVDSVFFEMPADPKRVALIRRATAK
jgi:hypothetical protein